MSYNPYFEHHNRDAFARWGRDGATERERQDALRAMSFYTTEGQFDADKVVRYVKDVFSKAP